MSFLSKEQMEKKTKKTGGFYLKWPWNLLVYIILAVWLGILAIPVILLIMAWNKKQQPDGPEEGYCLQRTRRRLARLAWAALFLVIGAAGAGLFFVEVQADKSNWEIIDYVVLAVAAVAGVGGILFGLYEGYTDIRDALFPAKSRLARSIRSQLPFPDEAPDVRELFAMVDQDIKENGRWFDRVAVGKEWILGDDVTAISRVRVVFGRDEIIRRYSNGRTQTARIIELYILDDRRQISITGLRNPNELPPLLDCISLRVPEARIRPYKEFLDYTGMSDMEWDRLEREFRLKKGEREMKEFPAWRNDSQENQTMVLTRADGSVTSRVSPELLRKTLAECLKEESEVFFLTPSRPIEAQGKLFTELECVTSTWEESGEQEVYFLLKQASPKPGGQPEEGMTLDTDVKKAEAILIGWLQGDVPDLRGWTSVRLGVPRNLREAPGEIRPPQLVLVSGQGVRQSHTTFTPEDVRVAADGLVDGSYRQVELVLSGGYLFMQVTAGDKTDGRCIVSTSRPDPDKLRFFRIRCTHRQAASWLLEFASGKFRPNWKEWKDYTKAVEQKK